MRLMRLTRFSYHLLLLISFLLSLSASAKTELQLKFLAEELPPIHFTNDNSEASGFLVDVVNALIAHTDFQTKFEFMPQARAFESTVSEKNVFMMSLLRSPGREEQFQWVGDVYHTRAFLLGLKGRDDIQLESLDDAKKFIVGTIRGYFSETFLREQGFSDNHNLGLAVRYEHLWGMLFKRHVDLVLTNTLSQQREISLAGYDPNSVTRYLALPELTRELHIATGKSTTPEIVSSLREALIAIKRDGTFDELMTKWKVSH